MNAYTDIAIAVVESTQQGARPRAVEVAPLFLLLEIERHADIRIDSLTAMHHAAGQMDLLSFVAQIEIERQRVRLLATQVRGLINTIQGG